MSIDTKSQLEINKSEMQNEVKANVTDQKE